MRLRLLILFSDCIRNLYIIIIPIGIIPLNSTFNLRLISDKIILSEIRVYFHFMLLELVDFYDGALQQKNGFFQRPLQVYLQLQQYRLHQVIDHLLQEF